MNNKNFQKVILKALSCLLKTSVTSYDVSEKVKKARQDYLLSTAKMLDEVLALMEVADE